jgi:hypothetical protein
MLNKLGECVHYNPFDSRFVNAGCFLENFFQERLLTFM